MMALAVAGRPSPLWGHPVSLDMVHTAASGGQTEGEEEKLLAES